MRHRKGKYKEKGRYRKRVAWKYVCMVVLWVESGWLVVFSRIVLFSSYRLWEKGKLEYIRCFTSTCQHWETHVREPGVWVLLLRATLHSLSRNSDRENILCMTLLLLPKRSRIAILSYRYVIVPPLLSLQPRKHTRSQHKYANTIIQLVEYYK